MVVIVFVYLLGGSFIDDMAFMILATPIFFPVVLKLGFDPVWFAVIIGVTLMIGIIIPPVAMAVFVVASITKESMGLVYKGCMPFLLRWSRFSSFCSSFRAWRPGYRPFS